MRIWHIFTQLSALIWVAAALWFPPLGHPFTVLAPFSLPNGQYAAGHRGVDLPALPGASVRAPAAGSVTFVGTVVDRPVLTLRTDARTLVSFEPIVSDLEVGDRVERGELIGTVSTGGHCAERCLHAGIRVNGEYVNPLGWFRARPVLLPLSND